MKHYVFFSVAGLILAVAALTASAAQSGKRADSAKILRGKYLVEKAGQCQDCHTPRNERGEYIGEYIKERWLMGSQISFKPTIPMPVWANESTNIAGLPGWENEDAITFLTGMAYDPRPPYAAISFLTEGCGSDSDVFEVTENRQVIVCRRIGCSCPSAVT